MSEKFFVVVSKEMEGIYENRTGNRTGSDDTVCDDSVFRHTGNGGDEEEDILGEYIGRSGYQTGCQVWYRDGRGRDEK